jgi:O-antigen/teichoic acid export membrane protein
MYKTIMRGIGANTLVFLVSLISQLVLLPILATKWGLDRYGMWILISTVPAYLALGDFGFATAAGNDMTIKVAQKNKSGAIDIFQSIYLLSSLTVVLGIFIIIVGFSLIPPNVTSSASIWHVDNKFTLLTMLIYGVVALQGGVFQAGFRCSGNYALGTSLLALTTLVESAATVLVVVLGYDATIVAVTLLGLRILALLSQVLILRVKVPWLPLGFHRASLLQLKYLAGSAFAVMVLPLGQAFFLQGTALAVGLAGSPAAVVIFAAVRTLTRTPVQFVNLINYALCPEFTKLAAREEHRQLTFFVFLTAFLSFVAAIGALIILLFSGQEIVKIWSNGRVVVPYDLLVLMSFSMVLHAVWEPLSNLLLSINRQASYTYAFLVTSIITAILTYGLTLMVGISGAGFSIVISDIYMFVHIFVMIDRFLLQNKGYVHAFQSISKPNVMVTLRHYFLHSEEQQ